MDRLKSLATFVQVVESGGFSAAARQLAMSPTMASEHIQALEEQLGVRLLQRTTRKVSLTVEGAIYLERCIRLLNDLEDVNALFLGPDHLPSGALRVDLPERLAHMIVIPALPDFFKLYPDIQVRLGSNDRYVDLVGEGIDCAVRVGTLRDSSLVARRIGEMEQLNCASAAYLEQYGRPHTLSELTRHHAVNFFSSQSGRDLDWEYEEDGQTHTIGMRSLVSVSSTEAYVASCRAGLGLIQAPRLGMESMLASGELEEVLPRWRPAPLPVAIVYSHNKHLSPRVRVFVDWLATVLQIE